MAFGGIGSKRIAGITIEIGADTTKLNSALKSFDKQLAKSKDSLKDIDNLLKLKPGNVTLLAQKQKELQKSISGTKERLTELKKVQKDSVTPEQWDALQREIIETESNLKGLEKEYRNFGSVAAQQVIAAGEKMQEVGSKIGEVGKGLSQKVTAPIVAGFGAALKVTADFDAQMSKVAAISGATGEDFDKLRAKAREMGAETKFSATEAGQAFEYMAMAGWKTDDMLDGIAGVMNLAAASGEDLGTTSDILTDALTAFGKTAADAGDFADVLAQASSNANTNVGLMGETFKYVAPVAGALGYNYRDVGVAIGLMANSGIKASQAGTALRGLFTRLAKPTKQSAEAMDRLKISMTNADGSMKPLSQLMVELRERFSGLTEAEKAQYAAMLAGQNGMSGMLAIVNASDKDFNDLTNAIANSDGAAQRMADRMNDNLAGQLTILKSQLEELAISIGDVLTPYARKLVGVVQKIVDKFNKLSPKTKKIVVLFGSVAAAIGPLLVGVGGFVSLAGKGLSVFGGVMKFLPLVKGALSGILPILTGKIGIIAGVIALTAVVLKATGAWDMIKDAVVNACERIKTIATNTWAKVKDEMGPVITAFNNLWNAIKNVIKGEWSMDSLKTAWDNFMLAVKNVDWSKIWGLFGNALEEAWTAVTSYDWGKLGSDIWEKIKSGIIVAGDWIKSLVLGDEYTPDSTWADVGGKIWETIKSGISAIGDWIKSLVLGDEYTPDSTWADVGGKIWETIKSGIHEAGDWIKSRVLGDEYTPDSTWADVGGKIWEKTKSGIHEAGDWIKSRVLEDEYTPDSTWADVGGKIGEKIKSGVGDIGSWFKEKFEGAKDTVKRIDWAGLGNTMWNAIKRAFKGITSWFKETFKSPINKVIEFLNDMIERVEGALNTVINGINSALSITIPDVHIGNPLAGERLVTTDYTNPAWQWSANIPTVKWGRPIKTLAKGGMLTNGQHAIVGEYKPEYLRVINGRAVVTPIDNGGRDRWRMGQGGGTVNNSITINQLPGESSEQLAERVQRVLVRWDRQRRAVYNT